MSLFPVRSILVSTDLRPASVGVLEGAGALAQRTGAELHVIHAHEFTTVPYSAISAADDYRHRIQEDRERLGELVAQLSATGVRTSSQEVREESAPRAILDRAREVAADLIVLGPARKRAFRGQILGNTADRLIASADIPVLVLRDRAPLKIRQVIVPIDVADPARGALDQGLLWAASLGSSGGGDGGSPALRVLYVIPRRYERAGETFSEVVIAPQLALEIEDAQQRVPTAASVTVESEIVWGDDPSEAIVQFAETHPTDLLVLGTHGYGAIGRALIGSVTSRVVRRATCPMLLIPPSMWTQVGVDGSDGQP